MALKVDTIQNPSSTVINLTLDTSGNVTVGNNLTVTGTTTVAATTIGNLTYTGTLTGSTGVLNIGSGQLYKDASGNVGIGTTSPRSPLAFAATVGTVGVATKIRLFDDGASNIYGFGISSGQLDIIAGTGGATTFYTNGSERMRIDSSGNVGIGTSTAPYSLEVRKDAVSATTYAAIRNGTAAGAYGVALLGIIGTSGSNYYQISQSGSGEMGITNAYAGAMTFATNGAERMRIDSSGNVSVGTATATGKITVYSISTTSAVYGYGTVSGYGIQGIGAGNYGVYGQTQNNVYGGVLGYSQSGSAFGIVGYQTYGLYTNSSINVNGTVYASDSRLKENKVPISGALGKLNLLNPVSFDWKADSSRGISMGSVPVPDFGLIAQEVELVMPEVVFESTTPPRPQEITSPLSLEEQMESHKGVDYSRFIPFLIAAIQELSAKVAALEAKK
jgi:hypothetical protein